MKLDFSNSVAPPQELFGTTEELESALKGFHERNQSFLSALDDSVEKIILFAEEKRDQYEKIVVLGVGGSALGTRMLAEYFDNEKLIVLDTLDPNAVEKVVKQVPLKKTLWIVVSKSGTTLETITLKNVLIPGVPSENWVVITEAKSPLAEWGNSIECPVFEMPEHVGGRFSVLTSVGLLPAALSGIPIEKLLKGAQKMRDHVLCNEVAKNYAWQLASMIDSFGRPNLVHWFYCSALKEFGAWWRQLVAESLGKEERGITPIPAMGPSDQHSLLQLLVDGEDSFFSIFVRDNSLEKSPLGKIMNAELQATAQSLSERGRPNCILEISNRNADTLGQLIVLWEMTVAFLGEIRDINAFDQPGVERGKQLTQQFLQEQK